MASAASGVVVVKRRLRKAVEVTHRWVAFVLGIALLAVVLSGVVLTFGPELHHLINSKQYDATETPDPIPASEALDIVHTEMPKYETSDVVFDDGVYSIYDTDYYKQVHVDPGTGEILGVSHIDRGFMGLMRNLHFCALACEEYPGYVGFLDNKVKDSFVPTFGNNALTWGTLILAVLGLALIFLSLGGIWLWWPSIKRFGRGFKIRRSGAYKLNYDLHKVVGIAAIPFLIMWGWTGAGFELKQVADVWYAVLPGDAPKNRDYDVLVSDPKETRSFAPEARDGKVTIDEAEVIAARVAGTDAREISILPAAGKTGSHNLYFADNTDPYEYGNFPGDLGIAVDRYSGATAITYPAHPEGAPLSQRIFEDWNYSAHSGFFANPGWRIVWGLFGLSVLLLAVTSIVTWLIRRRKRKRRGKQAAVRLQAGASD